MIKTIFLFLLSKNYRFSGKLFLSLIETDKRNNINIRKTNLRYSQIKVEGENNMLCLETCSLKKSQIFVKGHSNILTIGEGVKLNNVYLAIIGNNCKINIGESSLFQGGFICSCGQDNNIIIGQDCLFAHDVDIMGSDTHQILQEGKEINPSRNVIIGNHVWISAHSSVLKGTIIGNNSVVGAHSVVTKILDENSLYVGNPCRKIKQNINWSLDRNTR